jgi:uncharacterized protein YpiB (UPF0302 family)
MDRRGDTYPKEKKCVWIIVVMTKDRMLENIFFSENNKKKLDKSIT